MFSISISLPCSHSLSLSLFSRTLLFCFVLAYHTRTSQKYRVIPDPRPDNYKNSDLLILEACTTRRFRQKKAIKSAKLLFSLSLNPVSGKHNPNEISTVNPLYSGEKKINEILFYSIKEKKDNKPTILLSLRICHLETLVFIFIFIFISLKEKT